MRREVLAVLAVALIVLSTFSMIAAQPQECPKLKQAFDIYDRAKGKILTIAEKRGVLDRVKEIVGKADALVEEARSLAEQGNCSGAWVKLRQALKILRAVAKKLKVSVSMKRRILAGIVRVSRFLNRLERAVERLENAGYPVDTVKALIAKAKVRLLSAKIALDRGKIREAARYLHGAVAISRDAARALRDLVSKIPEEKLRSVLVNYAHSIIEHVKEKIKNITDRDPELASKLEERVLPLLDELERAAHEGDVTEFLRIRREIVRVFAEIVRG